MVLLALNVKAGMTFKGHVDVKQKTDKSFVQQNTDLRANKQTNKQIIIIKRFVPGHVYYGTNYAMPRVAQKYAHRSCIINLHYVYFTALSNRHASRDVQLYPRKALSN